MSFQLTLKVEHRVNLGKTRYYSGFPLLYYDYLYQ
ncbi:hypothetical protein Xedl_01802 [Xenorhabdus eapokensis]|uniref:Uncharacterized protein n=1 Tax=Xenorhabdus eapokensis TaxID=1873482 RepID=A0A1Q5TSK7_9GAMM|nr:hypothetical protein Xedl_01802 [Xenorhabdus eapokensis]